MEPGSGSYEHIFHINVNNFSICERNFLVFSEMDGMGGIECARSNGYRRYIH